MTNEQQVQRVGVLMGGVSREREISLKTGDAMAGALERSGFDVVRIDWSPGPNDDLIRAGLDVVLLALHGGHGEGGSVQGLLNCLEIPYTGSGVTASAIAMDKVHSKRLFADAGLSTPAFQVVRAQELDAGLDLRLTQPFVVKPAADGSSVGVTLVGPDGDARAALEAARNGDADILVEAFVAGTELSVGVFDQQVIGTVAIVPADGFYDYDAKYVSGTTQYLIPPPISAGARAAAEGLARDAYDLIGCRGVARVDVMLDAEEQPYLLEVNTLPGMTETSLIPKLAAATGESFEALVARMVSAARVDEY